MVKTPNPNHKWDKGVDFEEEYPKLRGDLVHGRFDTEIARIKLSILIIALANGSRIHEAADAYNNFAKASKAEIEEARKEGQDWSTTVIVEKKGFKRKYKINKNGGRVYLIDEKTGKKRPITLSVERKLFRRLMYIPEFIPKLSRQYDRTDENLCMFAEKYYEWNPHSLRYAFITHEADLASPQEIAKMTGHTTMNMILEYTQEQKAYKKLGEHIRAASKLR